MDEGKAVKRRDIFLWMVVLLPLWVLIFLLVIYPKYILQILIIDHPFVIYPYLPCGWLIALAGFGFTGAGVVINRFVARRYPRGWKGGLIRLLIVFLCVLPAVFCFFMGPAGMQIIRSPALNNPG